jgi:hypothetical protein
MYLLYPRELAVGGIFMSTPEFQQKPGIIKIVLSLYAHMTDFSISTLKDGDY